MAKNYQVNTGSNPNIPDGTILAVVFRDGNTSYGEVEYWDFSIEDVPKDIVLYKPSKGQKHARNFNMNEGFCPVPKWTLVDVILKGGFTFKRGIAKGYRWSLGVSEADIIFWRLSKPKKEKAA